MGERRVGCETEDGLLKVHDEDEWCDVCDRRTQGERRGGMDRRAWGTSPWPDTLKDGKMMRVFPNRRRIRDRRKGGDK